MMLQLQMLFKLQLSVLLHLSMMLQLHFCYNASVVVVNADVAVINCAAIEAANETTLEVVNDAAVLF